MKITHKATGRMVGVYRADRQYYEDWYWYDSTIKENQSFQAFCKGSLGRMSMHEKASKLMKWKEIRNETIRFYTAHLFPGIIK